MIPDTHTALPGLRPVLFRAGSFPVPAYSAFMALGVIAAVAWYWREARRNGPAHPQAWTIILSALLFGSVGARLLSLAVVSGQYTAFGLGEFLYAGRSIVGGLLGGWLGVKLVKRWFGITTRQGNAIAPAIALGLAIGRLGCFLGSCCYGLPTSLPWGINFGDGRRRHPTQLYEALFDLALWVWLSRAARQRPAPGVLFERFLLAYFSFRFLIEFIRVEDRVWLNLTVFQWLSLLTVLLLSARIAARAARERRDSPQS